MPKDMHAPGQLTCSRTSGVHAAAIIASLQDVLALYVINIQNLHHIARRLD